MYLMFIKDDSIVKIPYKSNIQLKINSEKFQNVIENNIDAFLMIDGVVSNRKRLFQNNLLRHFQKSIHCNPESTMPKLH